MASKRYAAFLSFAAPDRRVVEALRDVFGVVGAPVYFAAEELPRTGSDDWMESIREAIRNSSCFVPLITRNSLSRSWVIYETGAADVLGLRRFPVRTGGVRIREMRVIPGGDKLVYELYREQGVVDLVTNVIRHHDGVSTGDWRRIHDALTGEGRALQDLLRISRERWVFIAGSRPTGEFREKYPPRMESKEGRLKNDEILAAVARSLTEALLDAGFSVVSCANVDCVGKVVASAAHAWMAEQTSDESHRFKIRGLYPIDRAARDGDEEREEFREYFDRSLRKFREDYLKEVEWLLILGGNEGTMEEYAAAEVIDGPRIAVIPSLGGAGKKLHRMGARSCEAPVGNSYTWNFSRATEVVRYLKDN